MFTRYTKVCFVTLRYADIQTELLLLTFYETLKEQDTLCPNNTCTCSYG